MIILGNGNWWINAEHDFTTCPGCRICVPQGQACACPMRTLGPQTENTTRRMLTKEQNASTS